MNIGVMMRDIGNQVDAPGIIILNLMDRIIEQDRYNDYFLFYKNESFIDRYRSYPNVESTLIKSSSKLTWDQLSVPKLARKKKLDILFHPKHSIPLMSHCKTLMHLRGAGYWTHPQFCRKPDLLYQRMMTPLYVCKADLLIAESETVKSLFQKYLNIPDEKITRIYLAPSERFRILHDENEIESIKNKYALPSEFILTVTRVIAGKKTYYPGKNLINAMLGFQKSDASKQLKFVIIGRQTKAFVLKNRAISEATKKNIIALDFVPQADLPAIYNLAKCFLFPSFDESFGIPLTEAMACGCPVITSTTAACPEIVGDAGLKVNPWNVQEIATAIDQLHADPILHNRLREKGLAEVKRFNWQRSAAETLAVMNRLMGH
jgi:glycosyltransferase involved in cell wall biosynthesis